MRATLRMTFIASAVAIACAALVFAYRGAGRKEQQVEVLDPAKVIVIRTPGGMLEVATLQKVEEFGWQAKYECPLIDCSFAMKPTTSRVRVPVHYVYRIPLAAAWELRLNGDHYDLAVPPLQAHAPVAFDTSKLQIDSSRGWLSPTKRSNEQALVRRLGPELERRAGQDSYLRLVQPQAEKTVQEFAAKWMGEQKITAGKPIRVRFRTSP